MVRMMNVEAIERGIGRSWSEVREFLAGINASDMDHKEIAAALDASGLATGWWAQSATVAYEQQIGRRVPGQDCDGHYQVSVSKTVAGSMDGVRAKWLDLLDGSDEFSGIPVSAGPELSDTAKWRYWRCALADGSRVNVNVYEKDARKSVLSLQHEKLESHEQLAHWRAYWKGLLAGMA